MVYYYLPDVNRFRVGKRFYPLKSIENTLWKACIREGVEKKAKEFVVLIWGKFHPNLFDGPWPKIEPVVPDHLYVDDFKSMTEDQRQEHAHKCVEEGKIQFVNKINEFLGIDKLYQDIIRLKAKTSAWR